MDNTNKVEIKETKPPKIIINRPETYNKNLIIGESEDEESEANE